ncbi:MAG: class I SAM-dependent methyltransferase [Candidatus Hodarchaeota archaeon]
MRLVNNCPICDSEKLKRLKKYNFRDQGTLYYFSMLQSMYSESLMSKNEFNFYINHCQKCGFIFLNPRFSEEDYKIIFKTEDIDKNIIMEQHFTRGIRGYKLISKYFRHNLPYKPKVLDYGGGPGYLLSPFLKNYDCYVMDYKKYALPRGIRYLGRNTDDLNGKLQFNIIFSIRVLEHVNDPKKVIKDLVLNLNHNGIIYVQVPLGCLNEWKSLGTPFRHINFFSEESICNLFKVSGLNIIYLNTAFQLSKEAPGWKLDIIGVKTPKEKEKKKVKYKSTNQQRKRVIYYIPLIFRKKTINPHNIKRKVKNILKKLKILN